MKEALEDTAECWDLVPLPNDTYLL